MISYQLSVLPSAIASAQPDRIFVLTDANTNQLCLPLLQQLGVSAPVITIGASDEAKNLESLSQVWTALSQGGATRHSLLVNLGGGVVTDLGGLAAATFKRGIDFVNVPTTILAAVDAAVGGKTGINFQGFKNEIGVFAHAQSVLVSTCFFGTLPIEQVKSGYAEMLKHGMLSGHDQLATLLSNDFSSINHPSLLKLLQESVEVKQRIVDQDPTEHGIRKALNLGHTVGHAFESKAMVGGKPVPHGYAVAWGLVVETVLSHMILGFPSADLYALARFVRGNYGAFHITCDHYDQLIHLMRHDKKSHNGEINCTLLKDCGSPVINNTINEDDLKAALDIYRDLMEI